jgi:nitroimidazol reductase NimA-like FMN-containing flavoprotein (pyridoxamine 5'-phosphate oxidase superfamily)
VSDDPTGLLPWSWARAILERAPTYWIATVRPDGRPHVMPVWGGWGDDRAYLLGQRTARWSRNLEVRPACVVHVEDEESMVIVEGDAALVTSPDEALLQRVRTAFRKYEATHHQVVEPRDWVARGFWELRPRVAFGFSDYLTDATRWRFADAVAVAGSDDGV